MKTINKFLLLTIAILSVMIGTNSCEKNVPEQPEIPSLDHDKIKSDWEAMFDQDGDAIVTDISINAKKTNPVVGETFYLDIQENTLPGYVHNITKKVNWELNGPILQTNINEFICLDSRPCTIYVTYEHKDNVYTESIELIPTAKENPASHTLTVIPDTINPNPGETFRVEVLKEGSYVTDKVQWIVEYPVIQTNINEFMIADSDIPNNYITAVFQENPKNDIEYTTLNLTKTNYQ